MRNASRVEEGPSRHLAGRWAPRCARAVLLLVALLVPAGLVPPAAAQDAPSGGRGPAEATQERVAAELAAGALAPEDLASPRATMRSFLVAMNELFDHPEAWDRALATLDLALVPEGEARARARALYEVLNRIERVDVTELPGEDDVAAGGLGRFRYFPDPERHASLRERLGAPAGQIVLRAGEQGLWRFSADTVAEIPALRDQLDPLERVAGREILTFADWIEPRLPAALAERSLFGAKAWQGIALFVLILVGLLLDLAVRGLLRGLSHRFALRMRGREDPEELRRTLRPFGLAAAAGFWLLTLGFVGLAGFVGDVLIGVLRIALVALVTLAVWRLIDLGATVLAGRAELTTTRIDDVLVPLVTRALKIFVVVIGVIYGADALDIPIMPLLASLTVVGVGFSFAAKDTVENFFGSIAVLLDRPFDIGDWVKIGETEGLVEEVGFRSTRIRTFTNSQITVPNSNLVRAVVDNLGRRRYRRWSTTLALQYDTPPERLAAFTEGVRELVRMHPWTRKDSYHVWAHEFGDSSLDVLLYVFFEVPDWGTELRERERLFLDVMRLADRLGVSFAFPTRTLHVFRGEVPEPASLPVPEAGSDEAAHAEGVAAAHAVAGGQPWTRERPAPLALPLAPTGPSGPGSGDDGAGRG